MDGSRPRILTFVDYYLPGYKSGGPVRSVANMVSMISTDVEFWIVTRDRDFLDLQPYTGVEIGAWNRVGRAMVFYSQSHHLGRLMLARLIKEVDPAVIYLNSYFSTTTIRFFAWRRLGLHAEIPVVLAPRGEFSPGALRLKWLKKTVYNLLARSIGLCERITWQASSALEESDIRASCGEDIRVRVAPIHVAPDFPCAADAGGRSAARRCPKDRGSVRLVFLSRISPMKNLLFATEALRHLRGDVSFDIFGPLDSDDYWRESQMAIKTLPSGVRVTYRGSIEHDAVIETLMSYHFFLLPTLGENFGHAIFESFTAGCPVIISDRTQWRDLVDLHLGWDISLDEPERWRSILQECVSMDAACYNGMSEACHAFARTWVESSGTLAKNIALFRDAIQRKAGVNAV